MTESAPAVNGPREKVAELIGCEEAAEELLFADGLDAALIGVVERFGMEPIALYDRDKVIEGFMAEAEPYDEDDEGFDPHTQAEEHFGFNVIGAWVGERTPAFAKLLPRKHEVCQLPQAIEVGEGTAANAARDKFLASDSNYQTTGSYVDGRDAWDAAIAWVNSQR